MRAQPRSEFGFTLIELLLAMAIAAVLFGISSILLSNLIPKANFNSITEVLLAEIRLQQLKAMVGEKNIDDQADDYGVFIESNRYVLFEGEVYDPNSSSNVVVDLPSTILLSASPNQPFVFQRRNGEILNFVPNFQTITVTDTQTSQSDIIYLNLYGIPE